METEIWPNVTRLSRARGMRLALANGRISDRSFPRYRAMRPIVRGVLRHYEHILAREETDRARFIDIGARPETVETTGNVKFDYVPDERPLDFPLHQLIAGRRVLILASTMPGEDELLIPEAKRLSDWFVIVAPRKPDRFELVWALMPEGAIRRSELPVSSCQWKPEEVRLRFARSSQNSIFDDHVMLSRSRGCAAPTTDENKGCHWQLVCQCGFKRDTGRQAARLRRAQSSRGTPNDG